MSDEIQVEDPAGTTPAEQTEAPLQDPVAKELDRVRKPKSEKEKAEYTLRSVANRAKELGIDPAKVIGLESPATEEEQVSNDTPVTMGMLQKMQQDQATKTAIQMAEEITDEAERELVKHHIAHTIRASGNPAEDLRNARAIVNSVKNGQIAQEAARKTTARSFSSAPGAGARVDADSVELTPDEMAFTRPPYNLTPAQIVEARGR